jgi:hypothetical protein
MNKKSILIACLLLVVSLLFVIFSPYLTLINIKNAAQNKDSEKLSQYVDYPTLRESFKANVSALMASEMTKSNNGFEALGMALGAALVNQMVDAYITPENLAMMLNGQSTQIGGNSTPGPVETTTPSKVDADILMSYEGMNQFIVKIKSKGAPGEPVALIFKRYGIISWKLAGLRLPASLFNSGSPVGQTPSDSSQNAEQSTATNVNDTLLIPTLSNKVYQPADPSNNSYQDFISFDITLDTSKLTKPTRAVKGVLVFTDLFGEEKFRLNWTINDPLTPGVSYTGKGIGFNFNQFEESHIWIRDTDLKDMKSRFEVTNILYQDETTNSNESVHYPTATGYVVDEANIIDPDVKNRIEGSIQELKQKTTAEVAVVTVETTAPLTIEEYSVNLFNRLGIGQKSNDNGVLLLVAYKDRQMRIEVGKGLEGAITNDYSDQIINTIMTPEFKNGNFSSGIEKATIALINLIKR